MYVALFSSNIHMLVIYLFYVTQKTCLCYCSPWHMLFKKSHNMHMFFFCLQCAWTHVITQHGVQFHTVTMGSYKFYGWVSWSCFNCVITERLRVTVNPQSLRFVTWVWEAVLISQQSTQKHTILIHVRHHVSDIFELLLFADTFVLDSTPVSTRLPGERLLLCQTIWQR